MLNIDHSWTRFVVMMMAILLSPTTLAAEKFSGKTLKADFTTFYETLKHSHYDLFVHRPKPEYDRKFQDMLTEIQSPMTRQEAEAYFQVFAAYGNVAHSRIELDRSHFEAYRQKGGGIIPITVRIVDGRTYVSTNSSAEDALLPGSEILTLNGLPMSTWLKRLLKKISADTPYLAWSQLESLFPLELWHEAGSVDHFTLAIRRPEGELQRINVPALSRDAMQANAATTLSVMPWWHGSQTSRLSSPLNFECVQARPPSARTSEDLIAPQCHLPCPGSTLSNTPRHPTAKSFTIRYQRSNRARGHDFRETCT